MDFKSTKVILLSSLAIAALASGCMDSQRSEANTGCENQYVGRQKAACQMGVNVAYDKAKTEDGASVATKYKKAVGQCGQLEKPLITPCVSGVKYFRAAIARASSGQGVDQDTPTRKVASRKVASSKSRAPASVATTQPAQ